MTILQSRRAVVRAPLIGGVIAYAGSSAPSGWLFCYGQNVSRTTYAALFAVIGTTYGAGDGSTTFGVPDLRGRVPFGKDDMGGAAASRLTNSATGGITGSGLGNAGGEQAHTPTLAETVSHGHTVSASGALSFAAGGSEALTTLVNAPGGNNSATSNSAGSSAAHNTVPPGIVLNYMIFAGE
jgi:microcystin-dependent protein